MDYQTLRSDFQELLNRNDCTETQADRFIALALRRTERLLRTPMQEATVELTLIDNKTAIPSDYLSVKNIQTSDELLPRITEHQAVNGHVGFTIQGSDFVVHNLSTDVTKITLTYYNEFNASLSDAGISSYTAVIPDVIVYGALIYAANHFVDERARSFNEMYSQLVKEVQMMADQDVLQSGASIMPMDGGGIA